MAQRAELRFAAVAQRAWQVPSLWAENGTGLADLRKKKWHGSGSMGAKQGVNCRNRTIVAVYRGEHPVPAKEFYAATHPK